MRPTRRIPRVTTSRFHRNAHSYALPAANRVHSDTMLRERVTEWKREWTPGPLTKDEMEQAVALTVALISVGRWSFLVQRMCTCAQADALFSLSGIVRQFWEEGYVCKQLLSDEACVVSLRGGSYTYRQDLQPSIDAINVLVDDLASRLLQEGRIQDAHEV